MTGEASNIDSATVGMAPITVPGAPTDLSATPSSGTTTIKLSWTEPADTGGAVTTGYKIQSSPNGTDTWTDVETDTGNTATTYSHNNLTAGETIHYQVLAINSEGPGEPSNVVQATVADDPPLTSPTRSLPTVKVYPNPATDALYLDLEEGQDYTVTLISLIGRMVVEEHHRGGGSLRLALPDISEGIYILKVQDGEGKVRSFKIVR